MRSQLWHVRQSSTEHHRWFENLLELHSLTLSWVSHLESDQRTTTHQLRRIAHLPEIADSLKILEQLTQRKIPENIENVLAEEYPEEFLKRLESTVWSAQAWSIRGVMEQIEPSEQGALLNRLEQISWREGNKIAAKRWPYFPENARQDLRGILASLHLLPLWGASPHSPYLLRRVLSRRLELELLCCPHQHRSMEVRPFATELCSLHTHWLRGFVYHLNTKILLDYKPVTPWPFNLETPEDKADTNASSTPARCQWIFRFASHEDEF